MFCYQDLPGRGRCHQCQSQILGKILNDYVPTFLRLERCLFKQINKQVTSLSKVVVVEAKEISPNKIGNFLPRFCGKQNSG